jgi:hypothetical protein
LRKPAAPQRPSASASPAASASAPPPPPAAAPSREVTVSFESDPPGAAVFLDGDGDGAGADAAPLGVTPFARTFPRSDAPIRIELRLPGHEPLRLSTPADADRVISARLTRVGPPPAPARKPKDGTKDGRHEPDKARQLDQEGRPVEPDPVVPPLERETTINPFR